MERAKILLFYTVTKTTLFDNYLNHIIDYPQHYSIITKHNCFVELIELRNTLDFKLLEQKRLSHSLGTERYIPKQYYDTVQDSIYCIDLCIASLGYRVNSSSLRYLKDIWSSLVASMPSLPIATENLKHHEPAMSQLTPDLAGPGSIRLTKNEIKQIIGSPQELYWANVDQNQMLKECHAQAPKFLGELGISLKANA